MTRESPRCFAPRDTTHLTTTLFLNNSTQAASGARRKKVIGMFRRLPSARMKRRSSSKQISTNNARARRQNTNSNVHGRRRIFSTGVPLQNSSPRRDASFKFKSRFRSDAPRERERVDSCPHAFPTIFILVHSNPLRPGATHQVHLPAFDTLRPGKGPTFEKGHLACVSRRPDTRTKAYFKRGK